MRSSTFFIFLCATLLVVASLYYAHEKKSKLTFSNTQTWDVLLHALSERPLTLIPDAYEKLEISAPTTNTSRETQNELKTLRKLSSNRTEGKLTEIHNEILIETIYFGDDFYPIITDPAIHPHTSYLIKTALSEFSIVVLYYKHLFDRVRPHILDPKIIPAIDVPHHPAYPSGHASQTYFIALLLAEINPHNRDAYIESANRIAHNREIAGLHYPSDSKAGRELAQQYFRLLSATPWFQLNLEKAKSEWGVE